MPKPVRAVLVTALLAVSVSTAAPDVPVIDRTLVKEPRYTTRAHYFLLLFGPSTETRIWCVKDGDVLYVDRNGNGDLTEAGERVNLSPDGIDLGGGTRLTYPPVFAVGEITERDGKTRHTNVWLGRYKESCSVQVTVRGRFEMSSSVDFSEQSERPRTAPFCHFNGPLRMYLQSKELVRENGVVDVWTGVGTYYPPHSYTFVDSDRRFPTEINPRATLSFPGKTPGSPRITAEATLKERC
jgi:hypothetical protein